MNEESKYYLIHVSIWGAATIVAEPKWSTGCVVIMLLWLLAALLSSTKGRK